LGPPGVEVAQNIGDDGAPGGHGPTQSENTSEEQVGDGLDVLNLVEGKGHGDGEGDRESGSVAATSDSEVVEK